MFTKMRIDANCTLDSQLRSFRNTKTKDPICKECNDVQSVTHVLLTCQNEDLSKNRTTFENQFCKYVCKYPMFSTQEKLQTVLNLKLLCKKEDEDDAIETICTFVKNTYRIVPVSEIKGAPCTRCAYFHGRVHDFRRCAPGVCTFF